jgi:hypothetical protein
MTLQFRVWLNRNERLWWADCRMGVVVAVARLLGIRTSEEPDEFANGLLTNNGNTNDGQQH